MTLLTREVDTVLAVETDFETDDNAVLETVEGPGLATVIEDLVRVSGTDLALVADTYLAKGVVVDVANVTLCSSR